MALLNFRSNRLLLVVLAWCACAVAPTPASGQFRFDSWTTDDGLPQVSVNSILQTRDGFLWLTTFGGLVRYDGLRFQVFNTGNTRGLRTSRLIRLFEDREGNLWISTEGQGLTRYKDEVFTTYTTQDGLPDNNILEIHEDAAGNALFKITNGLVQWKNGAFILYAPAPGEPVTSILHRTATGAVWYLDGASIRKFENGRTTASLANEFSLRRFYEDRAGRRWIGTNQNDVLMFSDDKLTVYSEKEGYPPFPLNTVYEDRKGQLWFGTRGGGLLLFKDGRFTRYTTSDGLAGNDVDYIYQDREGTIWVGTTSGLSRLTERVVTSYSTKDGLAADNVYPVYEDRRGRIWIGSWSGLTRYSDGVFTDVGRQYGVADAQVTSLLEDNAGGLWIGTWGTGVRYVKDGKVTTFAPDQQPGQLVRAMIQDRAGVIWFGNSNGLVKYSDGAFTTYTPQDGLAGKEVSALYEDRQGQLWIGTDAGLSRYKDGTFTSYTEKEGLAGSIVRALYEDDAGALWIGTYDGGLYRFKDGRFTHYTTREGLFDNGVFSIIEDGVGNFWISCNLGIYRVRKAELNDFAEGRAKEISSIPYNKRDGMLNSECNGGGQPTGIRARDGRIWFPTQQGVAVIHPDLVPVNRQPPLMVIVSLVVDRQPVSLRAPVRLQPGQVSVEINYSGLSFINPELVKFKYKLEGLDEDWVDAGTRRTAYYSHLPPGRYRFKVIAANRDGVWNEQGASLEIVVLPPFWRTWWFVTLAACALAALVFAFYRRRIRQLQRAQAAQEAFSRQLIESQENERRRIASELHDSLGQSLVLIKNWALLGLRATGAQGESARANLDEISTTATAAINEVREIAYNLGPYQLDRLGLARTIEEMVERVASSSPIRFSVEIDPLDGLFGKQAEINTFRIVQEAINNIVKHSAATSASLRIESDGARVTLTIRDDGRGFAPAAAGANGARGFGLLGLSERVRLLGGELAIQSEPGKGTTVHITLPREHNGR